MLWGLKTSEQGLQLPTQLHRCVQATKLGNHWLVLMIVEVGAPVLNLPTSRRLKHLADVCHQLVQIIIYTIQHISKNGCISSLECRVDNRGMHIRFYTHACETARPKKVCWLRGGVLVDVTIFEIGLDVLVIWLSLDFWRLGVMHCPIGKWWRYDNWNTRFYTFS